MLSYKSSNLFIMQLSIQTSIGLNHFVLSFQNLDVTILNDDILVKLCSKSVLNAMIWPHNLLSTSFFDDNILEEVLPRVVRSERDMILRMHISGSNNVVKLLRVSNLIDDWNDIQRLIHSEASMWFTEVVLHIDDNKGCFRHLIIKY